MFATVPPPRLQASFLVHTDRHVYAGSYINSGSTAPSKAFGSSPSGKLAALVGRTGQVLSEDHGMQIANLIRGGKLVLLETSTVLCT